MRIIGGQYRGKKLISPDDIGVRPTSDRAREALFNILRSKLGNEWSDLRLLDVFAGSGAFSLEAISRGMGEVLLVDIDTRLLLRNKALFPNEKSKIKVLQADALRLPKAMCSYDLLFMDAPYLKGMTEPVLQGLAGGNWLKDGALCMIEIARDEELMLPAKFVLVDERIYGAARVVFARFEA